MTKDEQMAQIMRYMNSGNRQIDAPSTAAGVRADAAPTADSAAMRSILQKINKVQQ